jgi:O-antigen ligase
VTRRSVGSRVGQAAGLTAIALLHGYFLIQPFPVAAKILAALFLLASLVKPDAGLLVFAGLAPLSSAIAGLCGGGTGLGAQLLEQMALAIAAGVLVRARSPGIRTRIGPPALLMAVVAAASAAALMPAAAAPLTRNFADGSILGQLAVRPFGQSSTPWAPLFAALIVAECGFLGWAAERVVRRDPPMATRLVLIALIGHAGAAVMTFQAVLGGALRSGHLMEALPQLLKSLRISVQTDVHAAASALLLAGVAGIGLVNGSRALRLGVLLLVMLVGAGLWMTGSRVAIGLGVAAAVVAIGSIRRPSVRVRSRRFVVAGAAMVLIAAGIWLTTVYPATRYNTFAQSTNPRIVILEVGLQMFGGSPVFGIGIARFYVTSAEIAGPDLEKLVGTPRENAHNNFLQVLAELGLVGLGAMFWWLAGILLSAWRAQRSQPESLRAALLLAIVACVGTWMTGHPLIVPEFAFVFWLYFGVLAAMTPGPLNTRPLTVAWILAAGVLVSVPLRARALLNVVNLEHRGFGVSSLWQHDDEQRYREAGGAFALYLPATGRPVEVPIRVAPGAPAPLIVDVKIGDRLLETITIASDAWQTALIVVPQGPRRFELVDFVVRQTAGVAAPPVLLRVGRDAVQ